MAATSGANARAVGDLGQENTPLIVHWNGSAWRRVPLPGLPIPVGGGAQLNGVSEISATNVWVAGVFLSK